MTTYNFSVYVYVKHPCLTVTANGLCSTTKMVVVPVRQASLLDDNGQMFRVLNNTDNQDGCRTCTTSISA